MFYFITYKSNIGGITCAFEMVESAQLVELELFSDSTLLTFPHYSEFHARQKDMQLSEKINF